VSKDRLAIAGRLAILVVPVALAVHSAAVHAQRAPTPTPAQIELGKKVFDNACAKCHGSEGRGDGPDARRFGFQPRDFTLGAFKCRCTPTGSPPTDEDLMRTVTKGLPGTPMLAHERILSEDERLAVVQYVKVLSKSFGAGNLASCPMPPTPLPPAPETVAQGKALYEQMRCAQCHGASGRGDGPSAASLKDDWGNPIKPYNFVVLGRFKCGNEDGDLFRTLQTGMTGSPMPSFVDALAVGLESLTEAQRKETVDARTWALVQYVRSLKR
jgi:mono/diheme cytochrome c family protein